MKLFEVIKTDGTREKVSADYAIKVGVSLRLGSYADNQAWIAVYEPGTWLEVWRREDVCELPRGGYAAEEQS